MWQGIILKSERNNPWFKPCLNILLNTQCAIADSQCLEYLGCTTLLCVGNWWKRGRKNLVQILDTLADLVDVLFISAPDVNILGLVKYIKYKKTMIHWRDFLSFPDTEWVTCVIVGHTSCLSLTPGVTTHIIICRQDIRDSHLIHLVIVISVLINTETVR